MALEGTLRDFSLADIFQLIGLQRKTGVLTLRGKDDNVTVTFLDGKVVGADSASHRLETRLGHVLIKSGMLTQEQLARALEIQKETLQRLGFILTHYQIISNDSLKQALQLQILQIVYRLFRWKDGDYHFSQETTIEYDRDNVTPISAETILMEGARMMDEWPIIEKRIRSYDMVFRKKLTDQEIVVVGAEEADEIDFDGTTRKKKGLGADKIRISQEEKAIYDLVDGTMAVRDIVEVSRLSEFDTNKSLYELLTRDLIEEVKGLGAAAVLEQTTPLDETEVAETMKAVSMARIEQVGEAIEKYNVVSGHLPARLQDLAPDYVSAGVLRDPWGNPYKYLPQPQRYLVIGFTSDNKPDTDLFLSHAVDAGSTTAASKPATGGIQLVD